MRRHALVIALPALFLLAAACGGGDSTSTSGPSASGTTPTQQSPARGETPFAPPALGTPTSSDAVAPALRAYPVPKGSVPHDVAPAKDGGVWYTAQGKGKLGYLDPSTGSVREVDLGTGSAPHGVIVEPDGAAWVTDSGRNAIVRVDAVTSEVKAFPLPSSAGNVNLNTAAFDKKGRLWFTGQGGAYGSLDPSTGKMTLSKAPAGPYGITVTPNGDVYYASLAGNHIARIDPETGVATRIDPPTANQGARRIWSDSRGRVWVSEWDAGQVAMYDPASKAWREWKLPGAHPQAYAVFVDDRDKVWLSDFGSNSVLRFDPETERFETFALPHAPGNVRQLNGRPGEVWGAESANDQIVVIH